MLLIANNFPPLLLKEPNFFKVPGEKRMIREVAPLPDPWDESPQV